MKRGYTTRGAKKREPRQKMERASGEQPWEWCSRVKVVVNWTQDDLLLVPFILHHHLSSETLVWAGSLSTIFYFCSPWLIFLVCITSACQKDTTTLLSSDQGAHSFFLQMAITEQWFLRRKRSPLQLQQRSESWNGSSSLIHYYDQRVLRVSPASASNGEWKLWPSHMFFHGHNSS